MKLVKNQNYEMKFVKISIVISENEIHACFCPFHRQKMPFFSRIYSLGAQAKVKDKIFA